jgi:Ni/Fe-hydrogenase 1 B-type cytochrome subunit
MVIDDESVDDAELRLRPLTSIYVYEAPLRLWHWVNAVCVVVLAASGYLIGRPPPSLQGDTGELFVFGYIRFIHFSAAQIFAVAFLCRLYWALAGNVHARQLFLLPLLKPRWWAEVLYELKWYFFLVARPKKYVGHNPLARLMMFVFITVGTVFMVATGFALYGEGAGAGHWSEVLFGWVLPAAGGSLQVHMLHRTGMWATALFVLIHVYAGVREDIMSRQSLIGTMVSGWRTFKD